MSVLGAGEAFMLASGEDADYTIKRSLRFNEPDSAYLSKNISTKETTFTLSFWFKRSKLGTWQYLWSQTDGSGYSGIGLENNGDRITLYNGAHNYTSGRYRDVSAWYHAHLKVSSGAATLYINGEQVATATGFFLGGGTSKIGDFVSTSHKFNGYIADFQCVSGTALDPTSFGESDADTGVWNPIQYTGSYNLAPPNYASLLTVPGGFASNEGPGNAFDGSTSTRAKASTPDDIITFDLSSLNLTGSFEFWATNAQSEYSLDGGTTWTSSLSSNYTTATSDISGVSNIKFKPSSGTTMKVTAFKNQGNVLVSTTGGVNGFHLDFAPTGGQVYSSGTLTGSIDSGNPITRGFDGDLTTGTWAGSSAGFELTFPNAETVASSITVIGGSSQSNYKVIVGGTEHTITFPNGSSSYTQEVTVNVSGSFTGIKATSNYGEIRGIRIDGGPLLIDHEAPGVDASGNRNHWTATNIQLEASTYAIAGTHSGKPGISFNGTNAEINLSSDADLNPGSGEFTFECYAYAASGGSAEFGIYDGSPGGAGSLVIRRVSSGTLMVERHNQAFDITGAAFSQDTWHHVAVTRDSSNNVKLFVDGTQSGSTSTNNTHNYQGLFRLGRTNNGFTNGYISSLRLIKGSCLYTSNFTPPSGTLGDYLTTKLLMAQSTTSATAATVKPSGVTITGSGDDSVVDSLLDSPTNYDDGTNIGGNYCVLNPLDKRDSPTYSNGNLQITGSGAAHCVGRSTFAVASGKWYWEVLINSAIDSTYYPSPGICSMDTSIPNQLGDGTSGHAYMANGQKYTSSSLSSYGAAFTQSDIIGFALDMDAGTLVAYQNGTSQGTMATGLTGSWSPSWNQYNSTSLVYNFGQRPFQYPPGGTGGPSSDYKSLCTQNLDDPLIAKGSDHFDISLWTGNGQEMTVGGPIYSASADSGVTNAGYMFNGDSNNGGYYNGTGTNKVLTTSPFTINTQLRIYNNFRSDGTYAICLNDSCINVPGSGTNSGVYRWSTVDLSSFSLPLDVTKLGYSLSQNSGNTIKLIEVDSSVLIDGNGDPYNFSPDLVWIKKRNSTSYHSLFDTVRGVTKRLRSESTATETTETTALTAFTSDGFKLGSGGTANGDNDTFISWAWDGGDLATNSAYNQSRVWSDDWSSSVYYSGYGADKVFDGSLSTNVAVTYPSSSTTITVNPAITATNTIRVYYARSNATTAASIGTETLPSTGSGTTYAWHTLTATSISSITLSHGSGGASYIAAIEVDGKILVDTGVIPVASLNDALYNQSQTWRTYGTFTGSFFNGIYTWDGVFSADTNFGSAGSLYVAAGGTLAKWVLTSSLTCNSEFKFYCYNNTTITLNEGLSDEVTSTSTGGQSFHYHTIPFSGQIHSVKMASTVTYLIRLFVDGKALIDNDITMPDVPSITSTVRANQTAGFSIVSYTGNGTAGSTIRHNLDAKPGLILLKSRDTQANNQSWTVHHSAIAPTHNLVLNSTVGENTTGSWNDTLPDSITFTVGSAEVVNTSTKRYIAYCFTPVEGYSAFTSHIVISGTNFVFLGFRARFVMLKRTGAGSTTNMGYASWAMFDTERDTYNEVDWDTILYANVDHAEGKRGDGAGSTGGAYLNIDILSNGIRFQSGGAEFSQPSDKIIVCAWAEHPFKTARAR